MKYTAILVSLLAASCASAVDPPLPIPDGVYIFHHRFAEHPDMPSIDLTAKIKGRHVVLINTGSSAAFPNGVIAQGTLMWHLQSKQWIIGQAPGDRSANEVGGCSDGPEVIDLANRVYWTC